MTWRLARSLDVLRNEINYRFPLRSKASDGTIGDVAHSSRASDHNPNDNGVVCALDITHDPGHGLDSQRLADILVGGKDERIKYIISNGKIASGTGQGYPAWKWRQYTGKNPHNKHVHISVKSERADLPTVWFLDGFATSMDLKLKPIAIEPPTLRIGSKGREVAILQEALNRHGAKLKVDGDFGEATRNALIKFQRKSLLVADGIAGPYTHDALK